MQGLVTERNAMPLRGPRFFKVGGEIMFEFVIDAGNIIGPRPALKSDSEKHPEAWAEFAAAPDAASEPEIVEAPPPTLEPKAEEPDVSLVERKDMSGFEARLGPAPETPTRKAARRKAA